MDFEIPVAITDIREIDPADLHFDKIAGYPVVQ